MRVRDRHTCRLTLARAYDVLVLFRLDEGRLPETCQRMEPEAAPARGPRNPASGRSGAPRFGHYDPDAAAAPTAQASGLQRPAVWSRPEGGTMPAGWGESFLAGPSRLVMSRRQAAGSMRIAPKPPNGTGPSARSARMPRWSAERRAPCAKGAERLAK